MHTVSNHTNQACRIAAHLKQIDSGSVNPIHELILQPATKIQSRTFVRTNANCINSH